MRAILRVIGPSALGQSVSSRITTRLTTTTVLAPCGPSVTNLVLPLYLASYPSDRGGCVDKDTALLLANSLIQLADEKILAYNYKDVPIHWRMLYTDVTLAKAISILSLKSALKRVVMDLIRELDLVLIVAGAPGRGRTEMVHDLIEIAQDALSAGKKTASRPAKKIKLMESKVPSPYITRDIPRLSSPPPFGELPHLLKSPFIITGGCKDWPAVASWRSFDHLRRVGGTGRVVPVETGGNYTSEGWGQKIILWEDFLKALEGKSEDDSKQYLAQHDLFRQFPQLRRETVVPDYVYTVMQAPEGVEYVAPTSEDGYLTNVWLGPAGTVSPAHTDPYYNCYCTSHFPQLRPVLTR